MVRYIIDNEISTLDELKNFNTEGYQFSQEYTIKENQPVFIR